MRIFFLLLYPFLVIISLVIEGCNAQTQIKGQIKLSPEWKPMVYLVHPRNFSEIASDFLGQVIDSADISKDGSFVFRHVPVTQDNLLLQFEIQKIKSRFSNHLMDSIPSESNYMPFVFSKGNSIRIKADASAFQGSFVFNKPSSENKAIIALRDIRINAFEKYSTGSMQESDDSLLIEKENIYQQYINVLIAFADTTNNFEAAMVAIRWISPTGDFERIPEFIHGQCLKWQHEKPDHPFVKQLCVVADKNKLPIMIGDTMPDYALPLDTHDTVFLINLLGEKLTLLDIWASWCAPCRKEIREEVIPLWNAYHDKGLQVIGYSIDANESSWKNAIRKDGSKWTQASHLTGDDTPLMEALRITTIPANYILDENGKVLARNLHGEELKRMVKTNFD